MAQRGISAESVKQSAQQAVDHPWFEKLARFGYAAKGIVYLLAGVLTARAAFGLGGAATDKQGALRTILAQPFGQIMLVLIAIGLIGYVLLRVVQATLDPEHKGSDAKGIAQRVGYLFSAIGYGGLAITALRYAQRGAATPGNAQASEQGLVANIFQYPLGRWLVGLAGLGVIGVGLQQIYRGWTSDFSEHMRWDAMSATERRWATILGRIGLAARGIVWVLAGGFLVQAAMTLNPQRVQDSGGALQALAGMTPPSVVGLIALGLAAYGVYMLAASRYARIVTGTPQKRQRAQAN
jgi:hypothetical protein